MMTGAKIEAPARGTAYNAAYMWPVSLVAALGGLLFGCDWVVIGGAKPFYQSFFHLTEASQQGWAMSCAPVGCLAGALMSGPLSGRFGRHVSPPTHPASTRAVIFIGILGTLLLSSCWRKATVVITMDGNGKGQEPNGWATSKAHRHFESLFF
jgi:MFS family permease